MMRRLLDIVEALVHRRGDREEILKVKAAFEEKFRRLQEIRAMLSDVRRKNPDAYWHFVDKVQQEIDHLRDYIRAYNHFRNTREDDDTAFLFETGLELIGHWFEGWYMDGEESRQSDLLRAFRAVQRLFPNGDQTLYRVVAVEDAEQVMGMRTIRAGRFALQSWTQDVKTAKWFYAKQYGHGETMVVMPNSTLNWVDKRRQHDFVVVEARIPGRNIVWTPTTMRRLDEYDTQAQNSGLYAWRINDRISDPIYARGREKEYVVYIPDNQPIPIRRVIPLHVRAWTEEGGQ